MSVREIIVETTGYRLVLVLPKSSRILALSGPHGYRLPSVSIPQWARPAKQLCDVILTTWKLSVIILDFLRAEPFCAIAEVIMSGPLEALEAIALEQLQSSELSEQMLVQIESILANDCHTRGPFSRLGWIDEAIAWLESETGEILSSKRDIEQYNAGGSSALIKFKMENYREYWMKATGQPNVHELSITKLLSKLCRDFLPEFISSKSSWNAWLMVGEARLVSQIPGEPLALFELLKNAVESMAKLQRQSEGASLDLLDAGVFDQRMNVFEKHNDELFDYLEEAMSFQTSIKAPRLARERIQELRALFAEVGQRLTALDLPITVVHGDMNFGNIVSGVQHCQFIDWCETYYGNPLITLQHLLMLNRVEDPTLRDSINRALRRKYRDVWAKSHDPSRFDKGFVFMPIMAIASTLYGRGCWLNTERGDARRQAYARTLARCMDRAAQEPNLLEALCH
jgi:hypothetical protein